MDRTAPMPTTQNKLTTLIDLAAQLQRDEDAPTQELRRRDRPIGQALADLRSRPRRQLGEWLARVRPPEDESPGRTSTRIHHLGTLLLGAAGLVTGWGAATAAFYYDGTDPVNVINVLAIFVVLQLMLLVLLVITLLPSSVLRLIPGARSVQEALRLLHPGRLRSLAARFVPQAHRQAVARIFGSGAAHRRLYGRVERWGMVVASQWFAVMFNLGALTGALALVAFSDLAFSWSTTLNLDAERLHRITSTLALPWAQLVPAAHPSAELIEHSRHFRLDDVEPLPYDPALLATWWKFLILCMICYGLIPRLITVCIASWRFGAAIDRAMLQLPGVSQVLDRLNREWVVTASDEPAGGTPPTVDTGPPAPADARATGRYALVNWAEVVPANRDLEAWAARQWDAPPAAVYAAGGAHSLQEDQEVIRQLARLAPTSPVLVAVKAWEPPVAECIDFLTALRQRLGNGREVQVLPLSRRPDGDLQPPADRHFLQWQRRIRQTGDPWLSARRLAHGEAA